MKVFLCVGLLALAGYTTARSPFFSKESTEVDSSEHGGPPGRRGTTCECGWANKAGKRVVGGEVTAINEFPFAVALIDRQRMIQFCGGTILTPLHILTAAHCTDDYVKSGAGISVLVGDHDLRTTLDTPHSQFIHVQQIIQHSQYNGQQITNDISVLVLERRITFNKYVGPACISPVQMNIEKQYVKVIGWGKLSHNGPGSPVLNKVDLRVVPLNRCAARYPNVIASRRQQICTHSENKGACMGDSGGPLVWLDPETNRYTLVGAVSFGRICASTDPSVYTDVSAYYSWIQQAIGRSVSMCSKK